MSTVKYRINGGQWQTIQLVPSDITGFTLISGTSDSPIPSGYDGTYAYSGWDEYEFEGVFYGLYSWYCSAKNKTLYSPHKYVSAYSSLFTVNNFNPSDPPSESSIYLDSDNFERGVSESQMLDLGLNEGDELEIICSGYSTWENSVSEEWSEISGAGTLKHWHAIAFNTEFDYNISGNLNSVCHGEGFDSTSIGFDGFPIIDDDSYFATLETDLAFAAGGKSRTNWFENATHLVSAKDLLICNINEHSKGGSNMFKGSSIVTPPEMLPDMELVEAMDEWGGGLGTYQYMFYGCTNLLATPKLPATSLVGYAYYHMFSDCVNLLTATELPATEVSTFCYYSMFSGCVRLTEGPSVLPAKTLAEQCYSYMFSSCTSLVNAPALPATTLDKYCYERMFYGCTSLVNAPALPATALTYGCYSFMFNGCTSLVNAPSLPVTALSTYCYQGMFRGCTSLVNAPALPATGLTDNCYSGMFNGCTSLVNAPALPATGLASYCYSEMFSGCTSLVNAPALPATELSGYCYNCMFVGCTSLVNAPALPATTLLYGSYRGMFSGCTSLNYIKAMFTTDPGTNYTYNWVSGVASTGTFVKNTSATWTSRGLNGVPNNWTIETASS